MVKMILASSSLLLSLICIIVLIVMYLKFSHSKAAPPTARHRKPDIRKTTVREP